MKTFQFRPTKHPRLFRIVDRNDNWENYFLADKAPGMEIVHEVKVNANGSLAAQPGPGVVLRGVTTILNQGYPKGVGFEIWLSNHSRAEQEEILSAAGEKGDKVHRALDIILSSSPDQPFVWERETGVHNRATGDKERISNDEWDALLSFQSFWNAHDPICLVSEAPVWNQYAGYAGTADALLILTKKCDVKSCKCEELVGKIGLYDWKTSGAVYASHYAQIAAYARATNLYEYLPSGTQNVAYTAILRLGTTHKTTGGYEFKPQTAQETSSAYTRFCGAKIIAEFEHTPFQLESIEDVPDKIEIRVRRDIPKVEEVKVHKEVPVEEPKKPRRRAAKPKQTNGKSKGNRKAIERSTEAPVGN